MNVELLNTVRERIITNAARFNMRYYGVRVAPDLIIADLLEAPQCKTQACVAGETLLATGQAKINQETGGLVYGFNTLYCDVPDTAAIALGIDAIQAQRLFTFKSWIGREDALGWPEQFEKEYVEAKTPAARAEVASRRILHFIATEGRE